MRKHLFAGLTAITTASAPATADIFLSEIRIDNGGADVEYFELYNSGPDTVDLANYTLLVIGDASGSGAGGGLDDVISLSDLAGENGVSLAADARLLVADVGESTAIEVDATGDGNFTSRTVDFSTSLNFENGESVTYVLVENYDGSNGEGGELSDLDSNDDGSLDLLVGTVIDAVSVIDDEMEELAYATSLGGEEVGPIGAFPPAHIFRNGDSGAWFSGAFGAPGSGSAGAARLEPGNDGAPLRDTPGAANPQIITGDLTITLDQSTISESDPIGSITGTVTRAPDSGATTAGELVVNLRISDATEAELAEQTITISDGADSATFEIFPLDDVEPDGDQTVTLFASATGYPESNADFVVQDDGDTQDLVINEVLYATRADLPPFDVEFVEIVNSGDSEIDLSGYQLRDSGDFGPRHEFRIGTVLPAGSAIVIVGGGDAEIGHTSTLFGTAEVQIASSGTLSLNDDGDVVRLLNAGEDVLLTVALPAQDSPEEGSYVRTIDGDQNAPFARHPDATLGAESSPGTRLDGGNFATVTEQIALTTSSTSVSENGDNFDITVTLSAPAPSDRTITIISSDDSELFVDDFPEITIFEGETTATAVATLPDDTQADGEQMVTLTAIASSYLNGRLELTVADDGDAAAFTDLVINEVDADTPGTDTEEFIELYNTTDAEQSLNGLLLLVVNGSNLQTAGTPIDLAGFTIPASGYFVAGGSAAANVDLLLPNNTLQNGADAIVLIEGLATEFPNGTPLAAVVSAGLIDAIVYDTSDADIPELIDALTPGGVQINENENGNQTTESIARVPDGGAAFDTSVWRTQAPTPGASNGNAPNDLFAAYAAQNGGTATTPIDDDSDGDGIPALVEYALGFRLDEFNVAPSPVDRSITFPKGAAAAADASLSYIIEVNPILDMEGWQPLDNADDIDAQIGGTIPDYPDGRGFARLRVVRTE